MMKPLLASLMAALAASAFAQIPGRSLVVAENTVSLRPPYQYGYCHVLPLDHGMSGYRMTLHGSPYSPGGGLLSVSTVPAQPARLAIWVSGGGHIYSMGGTRFIQNVGNSLVGGGRLAPAHRFRLRSDLANHIWIMDQSSRFVSRHDVGSFPWSWAIQPTTHPGFVPRDLMVGTNNVYVLGIQAPDSRITYGRQHAVADHRILAIDKASLATTVLVTGLPPSDVLFPFAGLIGLATRSGELYTVGPQSGIVTFASQLANQRVVAATAIDFASFAFALEDRTIRMSSDPSTVIYSTDGAINDIAYFATDAATVLYMDGGCPNATGEVMTFGWTIPPAIGEANYSAVLSNGVPNSAVWLNIGPDKQSYGGTPLPASVDQILGFGGNCPLMVAPESFVAGTFDYLGDVDFPLPIPADPALHGLVFYAQAFTLESSGPTPAVITSEAIGIYIR